MINMKKILTFFILLCSIPNISNAQFFKNASIAFGLSTVQILSDNPASKLIQPTSDTEPIVFGGGFIGAQPGAELRFTFPVDEDARWRIPVGIDLQFFNAKERVPIGRNIEDRRFHSFEIFTPYIGVSYVMQDLKYLNAKTYTSLEIRAAMISNIVSRLEEDYYFLDQFDTTIVYPTKGNATRLGAIGKIGVEAMLFEPLQLNASVGLSLMNAFFRDDTRRELLTPFKIFETKERFLWNLNISILFQYTF